MTLVKGQTYRPMEQNGESKNMILSTDFDKSAKLIHAERIVFSTNGIGSVRYPHGKV